MSDKQSKLELEADKFTKKMDEARKNQVYIKLGDKRGNLLLSGAEAKWKADPSYVYVSSLRVAGRPKDIESEFVRLGLFTAADVKQHIAAGFTSANHAGRQDYLDEVAALKAYKLKTKGTTKASTATKMAHSIGWYADRVDDFVLEGKPGSPKKRAVSPKKKAAKAKTPRKTKSKSPTKKRTKSKSPAKKRGTKPLADKIANLSEGKVMDVSAYRASGEGAKPIKEPGAKSKKVLVPGTRIVSDQKVGIKAAAKALGDETLVAKWEAAKTGKAAASPRSPRKSKSPAKQLTMPATSPIGSLPTVRKSPTTKLPSLPAIGSPRGSPKL
jgi:hypothetical protein